MGMGHWGYAGIILQGVYAGGGVSEEVRWRSGRRWELHLGASLLSFGLDEGMKGYLPEKRKIPMNPVCERI